MAEKVDFKKTLKSYFTGSKKGWEEITFPAFNYLMTDGQGSPGDGPEYQSALEHLYPAAFGTKFFSKIDLGRDYAVPPLEGIWWADDFEAYTQPGRREEWRWTMMLMLPDWIDQGHVDEALSRQAKRKPELDFGKVRMERLAEGLCLQMLHVGPFAEEAPLLHRLHHELIPEGGYAFNGQHHEIYLSDPRRTAPEKLRTVLRQPVTRN